jgi:XTP/dITP diphosphohydrolase
VFIEVKIEVFMFKVLLASGNMGKLSEIQALLMDMDLSLITPSMIGIYLDVLEDGDTYQQNAVLKAVSYAKSSGFITIADDSGLEVDVLDGLPGIRSARFAPGPGATDADRRRYLLEKLLGYPPPWVARFRCVVALATPAGEVKCSEGVCEGEIIPEERGQGGFGYDPIFSLPELGRTMAELTMDEKNLLSHRAVAIQTARPLLLSMLNSST